MSAGLNGEVVDIEMEEEGEDQADPHYPPIVKKKTAESWYKDRFRTILKADYRNKKTWWNAVEELLKKDVDFREKVSHYTLLHVRIICIHAANCM